MISQHRARIGRLPHGLSYTLPVRLYAEAAYPCTLSGIGLLFSTERDSYIWASKSDVYARYANALERLTTKEVEGGLAVAMWGMCTTAIYA